MAGTVEGGRQAAERNKLIYGEDYYRVIGKKGGQVSRGGFFSDKEKARQWGRVGGRATGYRRDKISRIKLKEDLSELRLGNSPYEEL